MPQFKGPFWKGFKAMLPITTGVIPFGAVMGTVCSESGLGILQTLGMNFWVYAGAAQLASMELMNQNTTALVVITTGLIINARFLLYSAAMSPLVQRASFMTKLFCAYTLTDQGYAVMSAHQSKLTGMHDTIRFYLGCTICMALTWHTSVIGGFIFGNFAPTSWSLDYAVPLSFIALVIPTLKNHRYVLVVIVSSLLSILFYPLPYRIGLILAAIVAIGLAVILSRKRTSQ